MIIESSGLKMYINEKWFVISMKYESAVIASAAFLFRRNI